MEALDQTKNLEVPNLSRISGKAGTTPTVAEKILGRFVKVSSQVEPLDRFKLAREAARLGMISEAACALTWQEFESFTEDCLNAAGFQTQKGVVTRDASRAWQIDVSARKGPMILALDCKHWKPPNYSSKFKKPAEHQRSAVAALLGQMELSHSEDVNGSWALPVIVTLFNPRRRTLNGVALVSVGQLNDFLQYLTPYDPDLPFMKASKIVESPISQHVGQSQV